MLGVNVRSGVSPSPTLVMDRVMKLPNGQLEHVISECCGPMMVMAVVLMGSGENGAMWWCSGAVSVLALVT